MMMIKMSLFRDFTLTIVNIKENTNDIKLLSFEQDAEMLNG